MNFFQYSEANPVCVTGTSYLSDRRSLVIPSSVARVTADVDTLPPLPPQPQDLQHAAPQDFISPVRRTQSPRRTTPRRRRRLIPASPPSQRRSQLTSLTDRFLRVEEQRLELDSRSVAVLENMARLMREFLQRDQDTCHEVSQGLLAVGEGLKLLAEALKK
ncbi:uncharacterized protein LOC128201433 [Galleria mellonella]|uniref:Uncharacterized protein LOC128201433 n=1 Tax=Galleria mellonella TaxID=7137 RepID=A0ABM3MSP8_GALME|nr:uncharacterized protein LOC128201433 [Galleria mellonella]